MRIRPLERRDAPEVAKLWQYWFRGKGSVAPGLQDYVERIYLDNPWSDASIPSLVAEDDQGRILGFLGSTITRARWNGKSTRIACVMPPVVNAELASTTIASFLLRKYLAGPQDLTISDGGHPKFERIWELLGGEVAQLQSLRWVKFFKPLTLAVNGAVGRGRLAALSVVTRPIDRGLQLLRRLPLRAPVTAVRSEIATVSDILALLPRFSRQQALIPAYDDTYLGWLLHQMAAITDQGTLQVKKVVHDQAGPIGWFIYYLQPDGMSRIMQLVSTDGYREDALDACLVDAAVGGSAAILGRLEPRLRSPLARRGVMLSASSSMLMLHSPNQELVHDVLSGRTLLSRLEGENWYWWGLISERLPG